jgi:hypothetical protein
MIYEDRAEKEEQDTIKRKEEDRVVLKVTAKTIHHVNRIRNRQVIFFTFSCLAEKGMAEKRV